MSGEPRDPSTALECALRKRMPEAVEGSLLLRRSDPLDLGGHRRIELAPKQDRWREKAGAVLPLEDQVVDWTSPLLAPGGEELNDVGDQIDISAFAVLGRSERAAL